MYKKIQKIREIYRKFGLIESFKRFIIGLISKIYKRDVHVLMEMDLTIDGTIDSKIKLQNIQKKHSDLLRRFTEKYENNAEMPIKVTKHYIKNNYSGYIAFIDEQIIGYMWWTNNNVEPKMTIPELLRYGIKLNDEDVYLFDFFIATPFRGGLTAVRVSDVAKKVLKNLGYKRGFAVVRDKYKPARFVYRAIGFNDIKKIVLYEFCSRILYMNKKLYLKTTRWHPIHPLDYRLIYSFKKNTK